MSPPGSASYWLLWLHCPASAWLSYPGGLVDPCDSLEFVTHTKLSYISKNYLIEIFKLRLEVVLRRRRDKVDWATL